jgi:sugar O-acyltransferase (sialic acid O-acetyltransferase NeuD family)
MTEDKLVIVGDRLFGEIAYEYFTYDSPYEVVAFSVERDYLRRETLAGLPVVPFESLQDRYDPATHHVHVALTYGQLNRVRTRLVADAKSKGFELASYVSSRAFVWRNVELGEHCFIFENNVVQPFARIGSNVVMWAGNHIGHHASIGNNCFISSHVVVAGSVQVGDNCFLGVNSTLVNDITVGRDAWIGPHVTITRDVSPGSVFRPARSELRDKTSLELFGVADA